MENKRKIALGGIIAIGVLASVLAIALSSVSADIPPSKTYPANATWFDPEDIRVPGYCDSKWVDIWINTGVSTTSGRITFDYTPCCANVPDNTSQHWKPNTTNWPSWIDADMTPGRVVIGFGNMAGISGLVHIGALNISCCNTSDCCTTNLKWNTTDQNFYSYITGVTNINWVDGAFTCGNPIEVNKTVWNGTAWVDEIPDAQMDGVYRFRCEIHAKCCDLTNIAVVDTLSDSLEYAQNATVDGTPKAPDWISGNQFGWNFSGPLTPCNTIVIEFDARVVAYGYDRNIQNATAICDETGVEVSDEDDAWINAQIPGPDLVVTKVGPDYIFADLTNVLEAELNNTGGSPTNDTFNVSIEITNATGTLYSNKVTGVGPLDVGQKVSYLLLGEWKPTKLENIIVNVTVDCDDDVVEGDEDNSNVKNKNYTGDCISDKMSPSTCCGYRGQHPLQLLPGTTINGGLIYTLGDYKYLSAYYNPGWTTYTVNFTLPGDNNEITDTTADIPTGATIKMARLYVDYNWANKEEPNPYFSMEVNGILAPEIASYPDCKGFSSYHNKYYGKKVYNVTDIVTGNGNYQAVLSNSWPGGVSIDGMGLLIVYEKADEPLIEYYIAEGYDLLKTNYKYQHHVLPEDATTNATFPGISGVSTLKLFTVAPSACSDGTKNRLYFNDVYWDGVWGPCDSSVNPMATDQRYVPMANVSASSNVVKFQDNDDGFGANLAILIGTKSPLIYVDPPETIVQPQDQFDVDIVVDPYGVSIYGVEYYLTYNTSVVRAETQNKGPFLGIISDTIVVINDIDQANGIVSYAETRKVPGGVTEKDTVATIQFTAIGARGAMSHLNLTGVIIVKEDKNETTYTIENGTVKINNNTPPVVIPTSKHRVNNVAKKYPCITKLCACKSYDPDDGKGGNISYVRWDFGDGQYGTSEGEFVENCTEGVNCTGCQKDHKYESWQWEPFGALPPEGHYVQFNATLTLTDDGCPEETNSSYVLVNVYIAGDANGDGRVNILDAVYVGKHWGERCDTHWPPERCCWYWTNDRVQQDKADLNNDCVINILDAVIIGANWGHTAW